VRQEKRFRIASIEGLGMVMTISGSAVASDIHWNIWEEEEETETPSCPRREARCFPGTCGD